MVDLDELERLEREATPGPWKIAITKFPSGDSEWEYQLATERGHAATPYSDFALIVAARNALPDLIAELHTLRARVAELEHEHDLSTSEGIRARIRELEAEVDVLTSELEVVEEAEAEEVPGG